MAELFLTPIIDVTINKLIRTTADQINLAVSCKEELSRLRRKLAMTRAFLQDAGERQVTSHAVNLWLEQLRKAASDADDVLDEVAYENFKRKVEIQNHMRRKVCYFFSLSNPLIFQMKMAKKIKNVIASMDGINKEAQSLGLQSIPAGQRVEHRRGNSQTISFCDVSQVGRDEDVSRIVELLTDSTNQQPLHVISIIGMGGLGKTTLAQSVCDNERIKKGFAKIIWVCVSEEFDVDRILKMMLEFVTGDACGNFISRNTVFQNIQSKLAGGNYLLILDDVYNLESQKWEELRSSLLGIADNLRSRIVVTTRDEGVASTMGRFSGHKHYPKKLEDGECLSIIKQRAFGKSPIPLDLDPIGREIAEKCRGVPLVANVIGGILCSNMSRDYWLSIKNMNAWELPEGEARILSVLKLSFDRLPEPALKQCFAFCSIFPKDYVMQKKILIELWMAEGFIQSPEGSSKSMEDVGDDYFNNLLSYSLFQDRKYDYSLQAFTCKMHDLIHDLAQSVSKHKTVILEAISGHNIPKNVQHLNLIYGGEMVSTIPRDVAQNLHTLFSEHNFSSGMQADLKRLRVLNLSGADIKELSFCFDNMKSLRFLDISKTKIKKLPESFCRLYNLQTFRFMRCFDLEMPSEGIGYLINLRHIHFGPRGTRLANIGRLTSLQTLEWCFSVHTRKGCKIEELGSLSRLKGSLMIKNLQHVKDKSKAERAKLHEKAVENLRLEWANDIHATELEDSHYEEVLEGLRPHPNLHRLYIRYYRGQKLPSWMLSNEVFSPNNFNLVELEIRDCRKLNSIPVINGLSSLKQLTIYACTELRSIADRAFEKMSLEKIIIGSCSRLESLGAACLPLSLKELCIGGFSREAEESLDFSSIHHIHASLEKLKLDQWERLTQLPHQIQHLTALRELEIWNFDKLDALPEWLGNLSSLESLKIFDCRNLKCLPSAEAICRLTKLKKLMIGRCPGLEKSCAEETGAERPKISHIPNIDL